MPQDATYRPLKAFIAARGGMRLSLHPRMRDSLTEAAVEEFPTDASPEVAEEVLGARMRIRVRRQYGSVVAMMLISALVNVIVKLVVEWWLDRNSHRVLMEGWRKSALARSHVPAP